MNKIAGFIVLSFIFITSVLIFQNCGETGGQSMFQNSLGAPPDSFDPNSLFIKPAFSKIELRPTDSSTFVIGSCGIGGAAGSRINWTAYKITGGAQSTQGSVMNNCINNQFSVTVAFPGWNLTDGDTIVVNLVIVGVNQFGQDLPQSATGQLSINIKSTGSGGGGGGGGSGGNTTSGRTDYCLIDPAQSAFCNSYYKGYNGNHENLVAELANANRDEFLDCANSDTFMRKLVQHMRTRTGDNRWGLMINANGNLGRDWLAYYWGTGSPTDGATNIYMIDVIISCGANEARPAWQDESLRECCHKSIGKWKNL